MKKDIIREITEYISFLQKDHHLYISMHPFKYEPLISTSSLVIFNLHTHPYCLYLKTNPGLWDKCIQKQGKVMEKCSEGSFCGMCHAGNEEFIYPIKMRSTVVGFISVSGYRSNEEEAQKRIKKVCDEYKFDYDTTLHAYRQTLNGHMPEKSEMDAMLRPLCRMLELGYLLLPEQALPTDNASAFYQDLLNYINRYHNQRITVSTICEHYHCSPSYVSHVFRKNNGLNISSYVNKLRIDNAKALLLNTYLNIESIAMVTGFSDANYFSNVFKKECGMSPLNFRKSNT